MTVQSAIADRVASALPAVLAQAIYDRAELGLERYGQALDDNVKPDRAKVIHQLQELLDQMNYNDWRLDTTQPTRVIRRRHDLAQMAKDLLAEYPDITAEELCAKEPHSGATEVADEVSGQQE